MNSNRNKVYKMTITALLCAIGILIPLISPIKIVLEPASYTLGSHIPIFIAMFISPLTAAIVALGTTVGFFFAGFPIVVVLRAASHLVFALVGAFIIQKNRQILDKPLSALTFSFLIGILHGAVEMAVVIPFYFGNMMQAYYAKGFIVSIVLLVGVGTVVHSMFDFWISLFIWKPLRKVIKIPEIQNSKVI